MVGVVVLVGVVLVVVGVREVLLLSLFLFFSVSTRPSAYSKWSRVAMTGSKNSLKGTVQATKKRKDGEKIRQLECWGHMGAARSAAQLFRTRCLVSSCCLTQMSLLLLARQANAGSHDNARQPQKEKTTPLTASLAAKHGTALCSCSLLLLVRRALALVHDG